MAKELISIVIAVYDNSHGLSKTIESLGKLQDDHFEVVVVDDGSAKAVEPFHRRVPVRVIRLPDNKGTGFARNFGVRESHGTILAFTDSDCLAPPDWLKIIRASLADAKTQAVAGTFSGQSQPNAIMWLRYLESTFYHLHAKAWVHCFTSANFAIRRQAFERVGGFPPLKVGEDLILGYKLYKTGIEILWEPSLVVSQHFRPTHLAYFLQQMKWSSAVFRISLLYPEVHFLKWPVRRGTLQWQLLLTLMGIFVLPAFVIQSPFIAMLLVAAGLLVMAFLNLPFLRYAFKKTSLVATIQIFSLAIFWRNLSWIAAFLSVLCQHPQFFIRGAFKIIGYHFLGRLILREPLSPQEILQIGHQKSLVV